MNDEKQSSGIVGWELEGVCENVYKVIMRYQYVLSANPPYATYVNELGAGRSESEEAIINFDKEDRMFVLMPRMHISSNLKSSEECRRLPSPVVRALYREPPFQLKGQRPVDKIRDPNIELYPWMTYVLVHSTGKKQEIQATRQTADDDVPLVRAEILEHKRPACQREAQKCVQEVQDLREVIQNLPSSVDCNGHPAVAEEHLRFWKWFASFITEQSEPENFRDELLETASRMFERMTGSSSKGNVTCHLCNKPNSTKFSALNGPQQFQNHIVGKAHWRFLKSLQVDQA